MVEQLNVLIVRVNIFTTLSCGLNSWLKMLLKGPSSFNKCNPPYIYCVISLIKSQQKLLYDIACRVKFYHIVTALPSPEPLWYLPYIAVALNHASQI